MPQAKCKDLVLLEPPDRLRSRGIFETDAALTE